MHTQFHPTCPTTVLNQSHHLYTVEFFAAILRSLLTNGVQSAVLFFITQLRVGSHQTNQFLFLKDLCKNLILQPASALCNMLPFENASPGGNYYYGGVNDGRGAPKLFMERGNTPN